LLSASADATIWVWDVDQASGTFGDPLVRLVGQSGTVLGVGYDQDGRSAYSVGEQGRLIRWDTLPGWLIRRVEGSTANALSLNPATTRLASGGQDAVVRVWDSNPASPALGEQRLQLSGHSGQVAAVAFAPDGRSLASGGSDGTVRLWDAMTGDSLGVLRGHTSGVTGLAFSADSALLLSGSSDRSLLLWDVASGGEIRRFGGIDGTAGHTAAVQTVALSPDGAWALSGSRDNTLILWDVTTGALIRQFNGHTDQVTTAVFSPDGALILSASYDQTLRLWDATTGAEVRRFNGHTDWVRGAAFTRDGAYVLSSGSDGTVRVWDTATGAEVRRFTQRGDTIAALAVGSDMFAFTSREGGFTLARLDTPDEIVSWARENRAPYELSCPERERYQIEPFCDTLAPQALPTVFR
jgi:WD40 repeat protein